MENFFPAPCQCPRKSSLWQEPLPARLPPGLCSSVKGIQVYLSLSSPFVPIAVWSPSPEVPYLVQTGFLKTLTSSSGAAPTPPAALAQLSQLPATAPHALGKQDLAPGLLVVLPGYQLLQALFHLGHPSAYMPVVFLDLKLVLHTQH